MKVIVTVPHGIWRRGSAQFPEHFEYLEVNTGLHRIISALVIILKPLRYGSIPVWYEDIHPGLIRSRMRLDGDWQDNAYRVDMDGDTLYWRFNDQEYPWKRISCDEIPEWLPAWLTKEHERMDQKEAAGSSGL